MFGNQKNLNSVQAEKERMEALIIKALNTFAPPEAAQKHIAELGEKLSQHMEIFAGLVAVGADVEACEKLVRTGLDALQVRVETQMAL